VVAAVVSVPGGANVVIAGSEKHASNMEIKLDTLVNVLVVVFHLIKQTVGPIL